MKLFINDWSDLPDLDVIVEENREYPINKWITDVDGSRIYLVSAYVYDSFVMFFFMQDQEHMQLSRPHFEYEVNHAKPKEAQGGECAAFMSQSGEYEYLSQSMKDTGRIPEALEGKSLAFKKYCASFAEPVNEIHHLVIYPRSHLFRQHFIQKTFTAPYGACDIKIPYTIAATGEESYILVKEVKLQNMLESFDEHYEKLRKAHEQEQANQGKQGRQNEIISKDEMRGYFDATILTLSYLRPEKNRSFTFRTAKPLLPKATSADGTTVMARMFYFGPDEADSMQDGLFKTMFCLGEANSTPKDEYEIILTLVTDSIEIERKVLFEKTFP